VLFQFRAIDTVRFSSGSAGNTLRGALGWMLRESPDFEKLFAPLARGPSGFLNPPRPFVFRAANLDGQTIAPGEPFHFQVNVFSADATRYADAFRLLGKTGFGSGRGRAELLDASITPVSIDLTPGNLVQSLTVEFVTPAELKNDSEIAAEPLFPILMARVRDRLSTLAALYGPGPLPIDFTGLAERSKAIAMTHCDVRRVSRFRRSSRTGQVHPIGGFTGLARYSGDLTEFEPYLRAAQHTGVGRQTVWGNGEIRVS
jgi:CRISPR-associated endoribonuclease Cas6